MKKPTEFGVVLSSIEEFAQLPEPFPGALHFLSLPGEVLDCGELRAKLERIAGSGARIIPREIVDREIVALLPEQNTVLKSEFSRLFRSRCRRSAELHCDEVGLRINWEQMQSKKSYRESLFTLLRGTFGILDEFCLKLRIEARLPGDANIYGQFIREALHPQIALSLECLPRTIEIESLKLLRFYSDYLVLHFEPNTGRTWSGKAIRTLAENAGELCVAPRRFGIVTNDAQIAVELSEAFWASCCCKEEQSC
ncbi:MAG: hypothetical protein LBM70_07775 [Victivallales bacterium]|nr:hypothetical protein [Victivallales bacterium]